jgi:tRNA uridine 5-carbamoylmethylation protein Kti12
MILILSGSQASGKTTIANAIEAAHAYPEPDIIEGIPDKKPRRLSRFTIYTRQTNTYQPEFPLPNWILARKDVVLIDAKTFIESIKKQLP